MSETNQQRVWFITGASTGFGRLLAEATLAAGHKVVATARKPEQLAHLIEQYPETAAVLQLDVTKQEQVDAAVAATLARFGCVDVLVNNAGYGVAGAIEEVAESEFLPMFDTNVLGLLRVTRAFLPQFRKQRAGNILMLSSIGGLLASPGIGFYNASKFAVNGISEALHAELKPLGVHVTIIEPGPFRTDFLGRSGVIAGHAIPDYDQTAGNMRRYFAENDGKQAGDPAKAIAAMMAVVQASDPPRHLVLGKSAYARMQQRLDLWKQELDAWKDTTLGADFEPEMTENK